MFDDVHPGDPIPKLAAFWNNLKAAVAARRLLPGVGVRLREMPFGTIINFDADAAAWDHPWRITIYGKEATLRRGLVDGIEPKIGDRLMSGDKKNPDPPKLTIASSRFTKEGQSLICVEIECDERWNTKSAKLVQVARLNDTNPDNPGDGTTPLLPPALSGRKTRYPLVQLRQKESGDITAFQIAYFNLRHVALFPSGTTEEKRVRHFFFPG